MKTKEIDQQNHIQGKIDKLYLEMYPGTMAIMPAAQSPAPTLCSSEVSR